ncbi:hypothetical protein QWJ34_17535 [Saccharibacillus sp. CPCC 101409]|uniref:hypothetical protein n=1 Tax=Saccharibacillus sp. CPCC 101409 TaxID=3058041 RepID=UPI002673E181|nr:hypothetical protein [Saccharibacillus sp. CPCC 101409]MDO3411570.1 hypothetical protein [Saccharibacillus sp. CPCC 101409]
MELVFNDLCLNVPLENVEKARLKMDQFIKLMAAFFKAMGSKDLRTNENFIHLELASDYRIIQWINDSSVDKEAKRFFKSSITRKPYINDHKESHIYSKFLSSDFFHNGLKCEGIGIAHLLEAISISLESKSEWNRDYLKIQFIEIDEENDIQENIIYVRHASKIEHLDSHRSYITEVRALEYRDNIEWRDQLDVTFPNLLFCEHAKLQLSKYKKGEPILKQIQIRLFELNSHFQDAKERGADYSNIPSKTTPESKATLDAYKEEHTFRCPDGKGRTFSWHVRMTPGAGRIFFLYEEDVGKCIIGHIGNKLKTVTTTT